MAHAERTLWVEVIPKASIGTLLTGEGAVELELDGIGSRFSKAEEWRAVSHTFETRQDGSAVLTVLFEREVPYWESSQEEYIEEEG